MQPVIDGDTTFGVEVELESVAQNAFETLKPRFRFSIHDDGSTRGPTYTIGGGELSVIPQMDDKGRPITCSGMENGGQYGMELVTYPETAKFILSESGPFLSAHLKHIKKTGRTSIHLHVDVADRPWVYIKNTILWARYLEAILFRLASGGESHRGEQNNYRFCRPLSNPIGAYWGQSRKMTGLINWDLFLRSSTLSEMLFSWGRLDQIAAQGRGQHYIGHRLHMVNLASVIRQGTLEWRLFDALYGNINQFVQLTMAVHLLGASGPPPDLTFADLGDAPDLTCDQVSEIVKMDVSPMWGYRWQNAPESDHPAPHYNELRFAREDLIIQQLDDGTPNAVMFRR